MYSWLRLFILLAVIAGCKPGSQVIQQTTIAQNGVYHSIQAQLAAQSGKPATITLEKGIYHFHEKDAIVKELYISNHDQDNPKKVGLYFENLKNVVIDGNGSEFIFHGRMLPVALVNCENVTLKNFVIDFELPHLRQLNIIAVNKERDESVATIYPRGNYEIESNKLWVTGENYRHLPTLAMAFREDKRLTYIRRDVNFNPKSIEEAGQDTLILRGWEQNKFTSPGERFALRSYYRPTPGIFVDYCKNTKLQNITVHYAEGMGLIAQVSENIELDGFNVALRENDKRYFTTQADATHFSGCKGIIVSRNGLYEGMADDAINVHGTYLRVKKRVNDYTLQAQYMHPQAWGFLWGEIGDTVQFIESDKMQLVGTRTNTIREIKAVDKPTNFGAKLFEITFTDALPAEITGQGKYGIENLTWSPEVIFSHNTIRNNRARGSLFSTPRKVVCEENFFDHSHGTAILLCGDCNGWYETGACREVIIRNNRFLNGLTANYQFTNAIISIYPEIPNLEDQEKYFHSGIVIEGNTFETFDRPLLYAKSTDGLVFRNNTITYNNNFEPFHWNKHLFFFEKVDDVLISNNKFGRGLDLQKDISTRLSPERAVRVEN